MNRLSLKLSSPVVPCAGKHQPSFGHIGVQNHRAGESTHSGKLPKPGPAVGVGYSHGVWDHFSSRIPPCSALADLEAETVTSEFPRGPQWVVHKFGGTCMATAERIRNAAELVMGDLGDSQKVLAVVSALGSHPSSPVKVTDLILKMIDKAARQDDSFVADLSALKEKHIETAKILLGEGPELEAFLARLTDDITNLKAMLQAISIAGLATEAFSDFVAGHGELWSALLLTATCKKMGCNAAFMDAREVLVVTPTPDRVSVDVQYEISNKKLDAWYSSLPTPPDLVVVTGFIARDPTGQATTLRRNGSDYSATVLGALAIASLITIWTDVDGVYSADPRKVSEAKRLGGLTYHEAWELSYFGANVLHPRTTLPAMKYNIPITIRNFFNLKSPGTIINALNDAEGMPIVKAFSTIDDVSLISVEGTGMAGVPGIASKVFTAVRDAQINVVMISQASSEQSICFAVKGEDSEVAVRMLRTRFTDEIQAGTVSSIEKMDNCCVLAAVGQAMVNRRGMAATLMDALAKSNVNIIAIAQGSSEYNITVLIDQTSSAKALQAVHSRFYLSDVAVGIALVGPGLIGRTFLEQVKEQMEFLREKFNTDIRFLAIVDWDRMVLSKEGIDLDNWRDTLKDKGEETDYEKLAEHLSHQYISSPVVVDCTAAENPPAQYLSWLKKGIHVVTPNKKMGSGSLERYLAAQQIQKENNVHWLYEATVGAGLPIIATVKHLIGAGDKILKIEGIFSGTLSYIFNEFKAGMRFSDVVTDAKSKGYTEPDPRDDLAGMDVARKVTILARECGIMVELDDIPVESLVPEPLRSVSSVEEFMSRLPDFDDDMKSKMEEASSKGECLRYVGVVNVEERKGSVNLLTYPERHPFSQLNGSDNIVSITTERYLHQPLIVIGPGAGAEVTAGGVFSDLLRLTSSLGAPS